MIFASLSLILATSVPRPIQPVQSVHTSANTPTLVAAAKDPQTGYPIVDGKNWDRKGPWFTPVLVKDAAGDYVAVLSKQNQGVIKLPELTTVDRMGVITNWGRNGIRALATGQFQVCFFIVCGTEHPRLAVNSIEVKVNNQVFQPAAMGETFLVTPEMAQALSQATPTQSFMRLHLTSGVSLTRPIPAETVQSWPTVYGNFDASVSGMGGGTLAATPSRTVVVDPLPAVATSGAAKPGNPVDPSTGLPLVDGATWRTNREMPLSRPVLVRDEFDGEYEAVFDRDGGFVSNWSRNFVDVFASSRFATAFSYYTVPSIQVKVGGQSMTIVGENNRFPIGDKAARFLRNASQRSLSPKPTISFWVTPKKQRSYDLDVATVKYWSTIYREDAPAGTTSVPLAPALPDQNQAPIQLIPVP